jgi:hypothetical protein
METTVTNETTTKTPEQKLAAANARRRAARAERKKGGKPAAAKVVTKGKVAAAEKVKATDPKLLALVKDHAAKNKDKNGWDKVVKMTTAALTELLAGAKTPNAAVKRARAVASA